MERLGIALGSGLSPTDIVESVRLSENTGYDSAWIVEGHGGEQFSILTACALATRRIRLGTAISSVFVRTAPTIAMAAACLDHFSGGRFVLGLGSSHKVQVQAEHGVHYSRADNQPLSAAGARRCRRNHRRELPRDDLIDRSS
jgi:alkanesulfonate monooxygenase SsuD/methylene tetrahydromethanopterin reductase-like flavin-dependent oxidoreductase (luciferase family)